MLAQAFLTAADLGLTEAEHQAFVTTLGLMERGELQHTDTSNVNDVTEYYDIRDGLPKFTGHFSLAQWITGYQCGTVACIGGTAELVGKLALHQISQKCNGDNPELNELCYPSGDFEYEDVTVEQAAIALRSYLTTGKANWAEALGVA